MSDFIRYERVGVSSDPTFTTAGFGDGTEALPSIYFTSDPDTGAYLPAAGQLGFVTNTVERMRFTNTTMSNPNTGFGGYSIYNGGAGSVSNPVYSFTGDTDSGFYRVSANTLAIGCGGDQVMKFDALSAYIENELIILDSSDIPRYYLYHDSDLMGSGAEALFVGGFNTPNDTDGAWIAQQAAIGGTVSSGTSGKNGGSFVARAGNGSGAKAGSNANGGVGGDVYIWPGEGGAFDGTGTVGVDGEVFICADPAASEDRGRLTVGYPDDFRAGNEILTIYGGVEWSKAMFEDEFWNSRHDAWADRVTTGSQAPQGTKPGGWWLMTTGATATNEESMDWGDNTPFINTQRPNMEIRFQAGDTTGMEIEMGFIESSAVGSDDYIRFYVDASVGTEWAGECSSGGSTTGTTESMESLTTSGDTFKIVWESDTSVSFYQGSQKRDTITTNIPTVALQPYIIVKTEVGSSKYIQIDYVRIWQDRE